MRIALELSGVDEAGFRRLPKAEQNAFLSQAAGQQRPEAVAAERMARQRQELPVLSIYPSSTNRTDFDPAKLQELADSIREHGIMQPLVVRPRRRGVEQGGGDYELVMGERRWRAAQLAGLGSVPCLVRELDDKVALEWQLTENLQREDLRPLDEARGYRQLRDMGYSVEQICEKLNRTRTVVYDRLALLELPEKALAALDEGKLEASYGELLCRLPTKEAEEMLQQWQKPRPELLGELSYREARAAVQAKKEELEAEEKWRREAARYEAMDGHKILSRVASAKVVHHWGALAAGYVGINDKADLLGSDDSWQKVLAQQAPMVIVACNPAQGGRPRLVYALKAVRKAMGALGLQEKPRQADHWELQRRKQEEERARKFAAGCVVMDRLVPQVEARELPVEVLRMLARMQDDDVMRRRHIGQDLTQADWQKKREAWEQFVASAAASTLRGLIVEALLWAHSGELDPERLSVLATVYGVETSAGAAGVRASGRPRRRGKGAVKEKEGGDGE